MHARPAMAAQPCTMLQGSMQHRLGVVLYVLYTVAKAGGRLWIGWM